MQPTRLQLPMVDVIRGVAALVVALDHELLPTTLPIPYGTSLMKLLDVLLNGPMAVLMFFVVSGFCIHAPHVGRPLGPRPFVLRRLIRLGVPLAGASVVAYALDYRWFSAPFGEPGVWSLACEAIYYLLYLVIQPRLQTQRQWLTTLVLLFALAFGIAYEGRAILEYPQREVWAVTLMGLPVWLSGAFVAQCVRQGVSLDLPRLLHAGLWLLVLFGGGAATVLKHQFELSYALTLTAFGPFIALWFYSVIGLQIGQPVLKLMGDSSYSLYLLHQPLAEPVKQLVARLMPILPEWFASLVTLKLVAVAALVFYVTIEKPSHALARSGLVGGGKAVRAG